MKKILYNFPLIIVGIITISLIYFGMLADFFVEKKPTIIAITEFDGRIVTLYYDEIVSNNHGYYYTVEGDKMPYSTIQAIKSKDKKVHLYVDFNENELYLEDKLIEPNEILNYASRKIQIYHLDTNKRYEERFPNERKDYYFHLVSNEKRRELIVDSESFWKLVNSWEVIDYRVGEKYFKDMHNFLEIRSTATLIENANIYIETFEVKKIEVEEDKVILRIMGKEPIYYQLNATEYQMLNSLLEV